MLVFDITAGSSFRSLASWKELCLANCPPNLTFVVVGNKVDLEKERVVCYK